VLEIRSTRAKPHLAAVLLVRPPVPSYCKGLAAFPALEGLDAVLPLVVSLESPEVLQGFRPGVVDVVLAPEGTAVARELEQCHGLCPLERIWPFSIF